MMKLLDTLSKSKTTSFAVDWLVLAAAVISLLVTAYSSLTPQTASLSLSAQASSYLAE